MNEETKAGRETQEILIEFGDEFGQLTKHDVSALFVDLHASVSPLNPLSKMLVDQA